MEVKVLYCNKFNNDLTNLHNHMKKFNKVSIAVLTIASTFGLVGLVNVFAATSAPVGTAGTYGILSSTFTNTVAGTTVNGDVGYTTGPAVAPTINGATHLADSAYNQAGTDQATSLTNLNSQVCTFTFANGPIDLATDTTHGPIGVYTPGVYCTSGAASIGTSGITLSGAGTYIFRINGALTTVANSGVTLSGASACDVFWTPTSATTLGANSTFAGTNIDASGITVGSNVTWTGRLLAFGGTVTTNADTINVPTCSVTIPPVVTPTPAPVTPIQTPITTPSTPVTTTLASTTTSVVATAVTPTPAVVTTVVTTTTPTPIPTFPNTGFPPKETSQEKSIAWNIIISSGIFIAVFSFYLARKKQLI